MANDPTLWVTTIEAGEEIDETELDKWLVERGYPVPDSGKPVLRNMMRPMSAPKNAKVESTLSLPG